MKIMVQKFGGTSVQDDESRKSAMRHIEHAVNEGYKVAIVVSAIGRKGAPYATDSLLSLVGGERTKLTPRELDMIVSVGEVISTAVFTQMLKENGFNAVAMTGPDAGFRTNNGYQNAKVLEVKTDAVLDAFASHDVVVVSGFQGMSEEGHVTTLGRGGSDTSAALLAVALDAERVDIFTDVSGMMTADPRIVKNAHFLKTVSYDEVANMAHEGAKVIHPRAVEVAHQAHLPMRIRSTWDNVDELGTLVTDKNLSIEHYRTVTGIAHQTGLTQINLSVNNTEAEKIFKVLAENEVSIDFINISPNQVVFNTSREDGLKAKKIFEEYNISVNFVENCVKVSIIGGGMVGTPGVIAKMVTALSKTGVEILQTADSDTTVWILVTEDNFKLAVNTLHEAFLEN